MKEKEIKKQKVKILIVEDELLTAENIKKTAEKLGYSVIGMAKSATAAIDLVKNDPPDLILMDIMLRGKLSGIEAVERIHEFADIPVIYLTAYSDAATIEKAKYTTPFAYLIKPFENRDLYTSIEMSIYRHSMEKKLKESEENLSITLSSIGDGVIATDEKGFVTRMNPAAENMCGWKETEAVGKKLEEVFVIVNSTTRKKIDNPVKEVLKTGENVLLSNHTVLVSRDGSERHISDCASPIRSNAGQIKGVVLVFSDVTESYLAKEAIFESEKKFRNLFETMPTGFYRSTPDGYYVDANPAFIKMLGYNSLEELKKLYIPGDVYIKPEEREELFSANPDFINKEEIFRHKRKDGSIIWIEENSRYIKDEKGNVIFNEGLCKDITDKKLTEEYLKNSEEKFRMLIEFAPDAFFHGDENGKLIGLNDNATLLTGYSRDELLNLSISDIFTKEVLEEKPLRFDLLNKGDIIKNERIILRKDGATIPVEMNSRALPDGTYQSFIRDITERKIFEREIKEKNEMLQIAINASNLGIWVHNFVTQKIYRTGKWAEMLGYKPDEINDAVNEWIDLIHPDDLQEVKETAKNHEEGKTEEFKIEHRLRLKSGDYKWILNYGKVIERDKKGNPLKAAGIHLDIDAIKKTEEALRKSEERFQLASKAAKDIIYDWDVATKEVWFSEAYKEIFGYEERTVTFENWIKNIHPDDREKTIKHTDSIIYNSGEKWSCEYRIKRSDGEYAHIFDRGYVVRDYNGTPIRLIGTLMDLTERKLAEQKVKDNEEKFRSIINGLNDIVTVIDTNGLIAYQNPSAYRVFGYTEDEMVGKSPFDFIHPEDIDFVKKELNEVFEKTNKGIPTLFRVICKDGSIVNLETTGINLTDNKSVGGVVIVGSDVTEKLKTETALRESEELHRKLLTTVPDLIIRTNLKGEIIFINEFTLSKFNFVPGEKILGKNMLSFVAEKDLPRAIENTRLMFEQPLGPKEYLLKFEDGSEMDAEINGDVIYDADSQPVGMVYVIRDISERKQTEIMLNYYNNRLKLISSITGGVIGSLPINLTLEKMLQELLTAFEIDAGIIRIKTDKGLAVLSKLNVPDSAIVEFLDPGFGIAGEIINNKEPKTIYDARKDRVTKHIQNYNDNAFTFISYVGAPLIVKDNVIGIIGLYTTKSTREFTAEDMQHLQIAANHIAAVIENNKLFTELSQKKTELEKEIVEREIAEIALRESEKKYRLLFESNPHPMWVYDLETLAFLSVNEAAVLKYGYSKEEFLSMTIKDIRPSEDVINLLENVKKVTSGIDEAGVWKHCKKDGSIIFVEIISYALEFEGRKAELILSNDITERKQAEEKLRESESLLSSSQQIAHLGSWKLFIKENRLNWSDEVFRIFGCEPQEFEATYEAFLSFVHPNDRDKVNEAYTRSLQQKQDSYEIEHRIIRKATAEVRFVYERCVHEFDDTGAVIRSIGMVQDITERKRAEEKLRESEARYKSVIAVSNTGAWEFHKKQKYLWCSPEYFEMLGQDPNNFVMDGQANLEETWINLLHPDDRQQAVNHFADYLNTGSVGMYENFFRMIQANGSWAWIWSRGQTLCNSDGSLSNLTVGTHINITERKLAEEALKESEERFRLIIEGVKTIAIQGYTSDGNIIYWNKASEAVYGYPAAEVIGKNLTDLIIPAEMKNEVLDNISKMFKGESVKQVEELELLRKDGSVVPVFSNHIIVEIAEKGKELYSFDVELTSLKQAESELKILSSAIEQSQVSVIITDKEGRIEYINPHFSEATGYKFEEVVGQNPRILKSGEFSTQEYEDMWSKLSSGKQWSGVFHNKKKNGELFWESANISPITNTKGEITHYVAVKEDITEKVKSEEELAKYRYHLEELVTERTEQLNKQNIFLRTLIDTMPVPVFVKDKNGCYTDVNPAFEKLLKVNREDIIGHTAEVIFGERSVNIVKGHDKQLLEKQGTLFYENISELRNGMKIPVLVYKSSFGLPGEKPDGITGIFIDITERKKMEEQITKAYEREKELNELKTNFISMASHEFRTPLTSIFSSSEIIQMYLKNIENERVTENIKRIQDSVENMTALLDEVLLISRSERGKLQFEPSDINLKALCDTLTDEARHISSSKHNIYCNYNLTKENVNADDKLLKLILNNLLSNAIKYSPDGGKIIFDINQSDDFVQFKVIDEGIGITENDLKKIFEPFHRAANAIKLPGTGLGLNIALLAAELHGGYIDIESELNKGTTFTVNLKIKFKD